GELELRVLEGGDRLAERVALLHVGDGVVERAPARRDGRDADAEPLLLELLHEIPEALPLLAEQVRARDAAVLEEDLARVLRAKPELLELPAFHASGRVRFDEEQADAPMRRVRRGIRLRDDD